MSIHTWIVHPADDQYRLCVNCGKVLQTKFAPEQIHDGSLCAPSEREGQVVRLKAVRKKPDPGPDHSDILRGASKGDYEPLPGLELPPLWTQAKNYAIALAKHIASGANLVTSEVYLQRVSICENCPTRKRIRNRCAACGCGLAKKATWADQGCPDGHWKSTLPD